MTAPRKRRIERYHVLHMHAIARKVGVAFRALIEDNPEKRVYFLLDACSGAGWLDYGTSVRGAWLTPEGVVQLRKLHTERCQTCLGTGSYDGESECDCVVAGLRWKAHSGRTVVTRDGRGLY